jgi:GntR family transcriptional repressor for pyruvate dehydrogenase complex
MVIIIGLSNLSYNKGIYVICQQIFLTNIFNSLDFKDYFRLNLSIDYPTLQYGSVFLEKLSSDAACAIVIDYIIDRVSSKEYTLGYRLPPERDLARLLNVSRVTVREALKVLNYLGFIECIHGSGNYISAKYDKTSAYIIKTLYLRGEINSNDFAVFRRMLELQAFDLAAGRLTEDARHEMEQIVNLLDITTDENHILELDMRFHQMLVNSSGNPLLIINFQALSKVTAVYMSDTYYKTVSKKAGGFARLQEYHHAILDALISGDREKGIKAINDHFSWSRLPSPGTDGYPK